MCLDCLDCISTTALQYGERIVFSGVWKILLSRPWHEGRDPIDGFAQRTGGGGTWNPSCPRCFDMVLHFTPPPLPPTLSGVPYLEAPPDLQRHEVFTIYCRIALDDGSWSLPMRHSVELYIYNQLVGNADARRCFKRREAQGQFVVFYAPPERLPGSDGLNVRFILGAPADGAELVLLSGVAFGALAGCLADGRSPTVDTCAHVYRLVL